MKIFLLAVVPCFQLVERMVRGGEGTQEDEQLLKEAALNVSPNGAILPLVHLHNYLYFPML